MNALNAFEQEQTEILSEIHIASIIAAAGNHEGKGLLLLAMQPGQYYTQGGLHSLVTTLSGAEDVYVGNRTNQMTYCQDSLEPIGLVVKADVDDVLSYGLTDEGVSIGKSIVTALLDFADKYDLSLQQIFGATRSRSKENRSPSVRLKLIEHILTSPTGLSLAELERQSGVDAATFSSHLITLADTGLIEYNPWSQGEEKVTYRIGSLEYKPHEQVGRKPSDWLIAAMSYLAANETATLDELVENCDQYFPEELSTSQKRQKLSRALHSMEKRGDFVTKTLSRRELGKIDEPSDEIMLDEEQYVFWTELVNLLDKFRVGDREYIEEWKTKADEILHDPQFIKRSLDRIAKASTSMQDGTEKDIGAILMRQLLEKKDKAYSVRELSTIVSRGERHFSVWAIRNNLKKLEKEGKVTASSDKVTEYSAN